MNQTQEQTARDCAALSASGKIHFGEVVARLTGAGIERYHADYSRHENTFYAPDGTSCVVTMDIGERTPIADAFDASAIEQAVRAAQRGEVMYPEFSRRVMKAGCVGYFVQLNGQRVHYLGRRGEVHTEWFPGAAKN